MKPGLVVVLGMAVASCDNTPIGPSPKAAQAQTELVRTAAAAVEARFPGQLWTNVRERAGRRENAVCAEVAGQQVIYREKRQLLMAQSDFNVDAWRTLNTNWCLNAPPL